MREAANVLDPDALTLGFVRRLLGTSARTCCS